MDLTTLSPRESARWDAVLSKITHDARAAGIEMTAEMVAQLPSAKVAVWTESPLSDSWLDEAETFVPEVAAQIERNELRAKLEAADPEAMEAFAEMSPERRINAARAAGLDGGRKVETGGAPEGDDKVRALRHVMTLPPAARLSAARQLGIAT